MSALDKMAFEWITKALGLSPQKIQEIFKWGISQINSFGARLTRLEQQQNEILQILKRMEQNKCLTEASIQDQPDKPPLRLIQQAE
jgi:hypothetical protein